MSRISRVNNIKVHNVVDGATALFGDSIMLTPNARAFAVQREIPIFYENEGNLNNYPTYSRPIPQLTINESINMKRINKSQYISVDNIYVFSFTLASIFHVGTTKIIDNEARIKIFRQLAY